MPAPNLSQPEKSDKAHPGAAIQRECLTPLGLDIREAAADLGVDCVALDRVLAGQAPVTADLALRLEDICGTPAETWLRLQADYDRATRITPDPDRTHLCDVTQARLDAMTATATERAAESDPDHLR